MTFGGAVASLYRPYIGFLVYVCFSIIKPESLWHWSVPVGNYSRIVAIALLIGWVLNGCGQWKFGRAAPIVTALMIYWVWTILSATQAPIQEIAWGFVEAKSKIFLPFLIGLTLIDTRQKLDQLAWVILLSHGYVAFELNLSYYNGFNRVAEYGFGGMDNNSISIAMVTCAGLGLFLGLRDGPWWGKALAFISTILIAHVVQMSFSRGGMLGLILTGIVSFLIIPKTSKHYTIFAIALLLAIRLAGPMVQERFMTSFADESERDRSANSRIELWGYCIEIMKDQPAFGVGPDHFSVVVRELGRTGGVTAHSLWLQTGAEIGVPGLLALAGFYTICIMRLWPLATGRVDSDPWNADVARMVIAALSGFAVSAQFVSLEGLEVPYYVVLVGAGMLMLESKRRGDRAEGMADDSGVV